MKVLHISSSYYPAFKYGGPIESVYFLNQSLVQRGVHVDVFTTNAGLHDNKEILTNIWYDREGVNVKYFPYYFYEHYNLSPQMLYAIFRAIDKYDLVHITGLWNFPILAGSLCSIIKNKPYIISPRGTLYDEAINIKSGLFKKTYLYLIARHYLSNAAAIHLTTDHERDNITKKLNLQNKLVVVPNILNPLYYFDKLPKKGLFKSQNTFIKNKRYILFLGRINKQKGIDVLLAAFKEVAREINDVVLLMVGPDSAGYKAEIESWLTENHLLNRVVFTGMITGKEKLKAYVDADVFVLPSYFENFGMSVIEAMACGVPVIISDKVGISNVIRNNNAGIVVKPNPEDVSRAIKSVLADSVLSKEISERGRKLVQEKYNIDTIGFMLEDLYKNIIQENSK